MNSQKPRFPYPELKPHELRWSYDPGALSFKNAPNFENPLDADGDNTYEVIVEASDGTKASTKEIVILVEDESDAPQITSDGGDTAITVTMVRLDNPIVELETSMGNIRLELFPDVAPNHVRNFLDLAKSGFYDGLIFHRVIDGFMVQAGAFNAEGDIKETDYVLNDEISDSLHHEGTLAMARRREPNSASTQFYICLAPKPYLDGAYTVFGKTIEGLDVVHAIGKVETSGKRGNPPNWPLKPVFINQINIIKDFVPIE